MYKSISTIPIALFDRIQETGNLRLLSSHWRPKSMLKMAWTIIMDEYIREIGLSEGYKEYLQHLRQYATALKGSYDTPALNNIADYHLRTAIEVAKRRGGSSDLYLLAAQLSKIQGYNIDPNKVPVKQFYAILNAVNNG